MTRSKKIALGIVAGFVALIVIGALIDSGDTKTVTKTVTVTKKSAPVTKTPAACISALKLMGNALTLLGDSGGLYSSQLEPAVRAGLAGDASAINRVTAVMNRATSKVNAATPLIERATPLAAACMASR